MLAPWKKSYDKTRQHIKKQTSLCQQRPTSDTHSQSCGFSSSHTLLWELESKKSWALKSWYLQTAVLEKTLESLLDTKEIKPVSPKANKPWTFTGRTDAEAEDSILWLPYVKSWLTGKDPDAGKDWRQEEKEMTENEMVGRYHWVNGLEFEQALGDGHGQGSLACCSPWGHKESDMTEQLNKNKMVFWFLFYNIKYPGYWFIH